MASLVKDALEIDYASVSSSANQAIRVVGSLLQNASSMDKEILNLACARHGYSHVEFDLESEKSLSTGELLDKVTLVSSAVDLLVTSFGETDTFGVGRQITEQLLAHTRAPIVSFMDDIYAPQPALGILAALWNELGDLSGKNITISWGYGSRFVSPRTTHSLLLLGITLGADIMILSPPEFRLLRRVIREAENAATETHGSFQETEEFNRSYLNADAVIGLNWCRLDDCTGSEKNKKTAMDYKDWYFTEDTLGSQSLFIGDPPIQADLLASPSLLQSPRNLTSSWMDMRTRVLLQSFDFLSKLQSEGKLSALI
ncbi:MAG: hypothetical protein ACFFAY_13090 [Promethearchaeota archaeon]